jgi:hypothetical protein
VKLDEEVNGNIISFGDYFKGNIPFKEMFLKLVMHRAGPSYKQPKLGL